MPRKLIKIIFILFFSFTMYGFSRPATEEDELSRLRFAAGEKELVYDFMPVSAYILNFVKTDSNIIRQYGLPDIDPYVDSNGEGFMFHFHFRTRGGGRTCLNFIWIEPYDFFRVPEKTFFCGILE